MCLFVLKTDRSCLMPPPFASDPQKAVRSCDLQGFLFLLDEKQKKAATQNEKEIF